jgi:hypothetical protein
LYLLTGERRLHRAVYAFYMGRIPEGMLVCHKCDNPACCNINHLFLGSANDNTQDMVSKNRQGRKLDKEHVKLIREMYAGGYSQRALGRIFGVDHSQIGHIVRNEQWKEVPC